MGIIFTDKSFHLWNSVLCFRKIPKQTLASIVVLFLKVMPLTALGSGDRHLVYMTVPRGWTTVKLGCPGRLEALLAAQWWAPPRMQAGFQDNWGLMGHWRMAKAAAPWRCGSLRLFCKSFWFRKSKTHLLQTFFSPICNRIYIARETYPICFCCSCCSFILLSSKQNFEIYLIQIFFKNFKRRTYLVGGRASAPWWLQLWVNEVPQR